MFVFLFNYCFNAYKNLLFVNSWKCLQSLTNESNINLFCNNCNAIQALNANHNYFELFNIPVSYDVNLLELSHKFRSLQMLSHPDKFAKESEVSLNSFD